MPNTFSKIASITVGSGGSVSLLFTSIPQTFTDLLVKVSARSVWTGQAMTSVGMIFQNGYTGYSYKGLFGNGSSATSDGNSSYRVIGQMPGGTATANTFGNLEIYIPNYTSSNYKSASGDFVAESNTTAANQGFNAYLNTLSSGITSIELGDATSGQNFAQYSTATLYGIKNS
jgi:hypothetical protein